MADHRFLGIHMGLEGMTAPAALDKLMAEFPEIRDVQYFNHGPQGARPVKINGPEFMARAKHHKVCLWVHGSYICSPWNANPFLTIHTLANIRAAHAVGAGCVVVHMPYREVDFVVAGILPLVKMMREAKLCSTKLMLETSAMRQDPVKSYESPAKLNALTARLMDAGLGDCVRICIDTAHIFAGKATIRTYKDGVAFCEALDKRLIGMIQLNGNSINPDVQRGDRHEIPLTDGDLIWRGLEYKDSGCKAFIDMGIALKIPVIMEVNPRHPGDAIRKFIDTATADANRL